MLSGVLDRNGNVFTFQYDNLGRPTSVRMPGDVVDAMRYGLDGRLTWLRETSPAGGGTLLQDETMVYDARGKLLQVNAGPTLGRGGSTFTQWYSGLGNLVATDWDNLQGLEFAREEFIADPLGNRIKKTTILPGLQNAGSDHPDYAYQLDRASGRVFEVNKVDITTTPITPDDSEFFYDASGNQDRSVQQVWRANGYSVELARESESRSFYGSDERLRAFQEYSVSHSGGVGTSSGVWEEYRYDPLGRRVMVITQRPPELCDASELACLSSVTRFVWSGDQLLWERKSAEGTAAYVGESSGLVSYTHAGGIDRPLAIWKAEVGTIVTHQNWRGQFARGTFGAGPRAGQSSDCPSYPPTNGCIPVPWPGWNTTAWHEGIGSPNTTGYEHYWMGSLATGMRDASGQLYMRNRYYNPQTGQFTQPDPIGLAGGLNSYGFAAGDPVSYSDPYGLMADTSFTGAENGAVARAAWHQMRSEAEAAVASGDEVKTAAGSLMLSMMRMAEGSSTMYVIDVDDQGVDFRNHFQGHETCPEENRCKIKLDHTQVTDQSLTVRLGHELGGALMRRFHMPHSSGSMIGENAVRMMKGCRWRGGHNPFDFPGGPC
jgi:RHS repeat-associated protein